MGVQNEAASIRVVMLLLGLSPAPTHDTQQQQFDADDFADHPDWSLRQGFDELKTINSPTREALIVAYASALTRWSENSEFDALDAVIEFDAARGAALALAASFSTNWFQREAAIEALADLLPKDAFARAHASIAEPESDHQMTAVDVLACTNPEAARPILSRIAATTDAAPLYDLARAYLDKINRDGIVPVAGRFSKSEADLLSQVGMLAAQALYHSEVDIRTQQLHELHQLDDVLATAVSVAVSVGQFPTERRILALNILVSEAPNIARQIAKIFAANQDPGMQRDGQRVLRILT